jgi:hypothetical protein
MLLNDVLCHGEKVRLWGADGFGVWDAEHAQVDLLDHIGNVVHAPHARHEKASQLLAVRRCEVGHQSLRIFHPQ